MDYLKAGVDIAKGDRLVDRIKSMMGSAGINIGHFGGAVPIPSKDYSNPLLISSIDSVGTKVKIAAELNQNKGCGADILHHAINDIAVCGAEPLGFLDYIAMDQLDERVVEDLAEGLINACNNADVPLVGGEIAEMPGVYAKGEYDLVGSIFGIVDKENYIDGKSVNENDVLIGFSSVGLHTNGFSLVRKIIADEEIDYADTLPGTNSTIGEAILDVHKCYLDEIRFMISNYQVKGLAHITGGGLVGNVPRIIPRDLKPELEWYCWDVPPIFEFLRSKGQIPEDAMRSTFNLGIGLVAAFDTENAEALLGDFPSDLSRPLKIGTVRAA